MLGMSVIVHMPVGMIVLVIVLVCGSGADACDAAQWRLRLRWHLARRQRVEQLVGGGGDRRNGPLERRGSRLRGLLDPAHLADVLARGSLDLLVGGDRLQPAERRDVPAHARDGTRA